VDVWSLVDTPGWPLCWWWVLLCEVCGPCWSCSSASRMQEIAWRLCWVRLSLENGSFTVYLLHCICINMLFVVNMLTYCYFSDCCQLVILYHALIVMIKMKYCCLSVDLSHLLCAHFETGVSWNTCGGQGRYADSVHSLTWIDFIGFFVILGHCHLDVNISFSDERVMNMTCFVLQNL